MKDTSHNFLCGIPCSKLAVWIKENITEYIPVTSESEAIGLSIGAYLVGKKPLCFMQDAGLANAINVVSSFLKPYNITINILVSIRKSPAYHKFTGDRIKKLMEVLEYKGCSYL